MAILMTIFSAAGQGLGYAMLALGVFLTFKILNFADMTCDGAFAMGGCVSIVCTQTLNINPFLSLIVAMLAGALAGLVTGILNTKCKIPPILSGILTMIALYSINLHIMSDKANLAVLRTKQTTIDILRAWVPESLTLNMRSLAVDYIVIVAFGLLLCGVIISLLYWYFGTEIGSATRATGSNEDLMRALGQNPKTLVLISLMLSNSLIALAGAVICQQRRVADITNGQGAIVIGLASIVIGEVIFGKKVRSFWAKLASVVTGSIIYQIVIALVLFLGMPTMDMKLLTAVIVAAALSIPVITGSRKTSYKKALKG